MVTKGGGVLLNRNVSTPSNDLPRNGYTVLVLLKELLLFLRHNTTTACYYY